MSWDWVQHGLGPMWKPFLVGCGLTGALVGLVGYALLDVLWRYNVRKRYRERAGVHQPTNQPRSTRFPRSSSRMRSMRAARRRSCVTTMRLVREFAIQLEHQREHRLRIAAIEISGGFVGQHDARIGHQRARHGGALTLAARQLVRTMDQALAEAHALEDRARAAVPPRAAASRRTSNGIATFSSAENSGSR